jgi:hypothetical protein
LGREFGRKTNRTYLTNLTTSPGTSPISPVHFSNPSVKGLRPGFTTKAACAVNLLIFSSRSILELIITEGNKQKKAGPFLTLPLLTELVGGLPNPPPKVL